MRFALGLGVAVGVFAACGGQTAPDTIGDQEQQPQPDASPAADAGAPQVDSGTPTADAGHDSGVDCPYPAKHYPIPTMQNLGGVVLAAPKIVTVTFVGNSQRDSLRQFDDAIVQSAWWKSVTAGYAIGMGTGGVYAELDDTVSGKTLDDTKDLQPMIAAWVQSGKLPAPDANTLYAMYFPSSTTIVLDNMQSCQAFGGYHNSGMVPVGDGGTLEVAYAVMPDCGWGQTVTTSHEFIEAATDPHPMTKPTWYMYQDAWSPKGGYEVADLCEGRGTALEQNWDVAKSWVNAAAAASHDPCQPEDQGEIYFGAAVPTEVVHNIVDPTGGPNYDSDGYVLMKAGTTRTLDVVVFSEAALPNDLQLVAGRRKRGASDPTDVAPIAAGVTATLSPTAGHNCTHVTLTLQLDGSVVAGEYPFIVRAILNSNDYHSWPAILKVQ